MVKVSDVRKVAPTGKERFFAEHELIVSRTDKNGKITYCNPVFIKLAGFTEEELLGQPHSIVRHPEMPRCVFKLLWDTVDSGKEIFAYVVNMSRNGDHYWVFAHVTPTFNEKGEIVGYHSNRRKPRAEALEVIKGLYKTLLEEEAKHSDKKDAMNASTNLLMGILKNKGVSYDEFILSI